MARGPSRFRQTDLVRAIRATKAAGEEVSRIEVDSAGRLRIILAKPADAPSDRATIYPEPDLIPGKEPRWRRNRLEEAMDRHGKEPGSVKDLADEL